MTGMTMLLIFTLALVLIAIALTNSCGAWNSSAEGRCLNSAPGPFKRCGLHGWVTVWDFVAVGLLGTAAALLYTWFNHNGLDLLVSDFQRWTAAL